MIKSKTTTKDSNPDLIRRFLRKIRGSEKAYVTIGVHDDAGKYPGPNAPSVVEVALWNEFGTQTSPERSFIRSTLDDNRSQIEQWRLEVIANVLHKDWTVTKALETIGFRVQTLIQNKIKSNVPPPNASSTQRKKSQSGSLPKTLDGASVGDQVSLLSSSTLIDTGLMLRSIGFKVHGVR